MDFDKERVIQRHSVLLSQVTTDSTFQKLGCSPLLTVAALRLAQQQRSLISQYGLLARVMRTTSQQTTQDWNNASESRLFFNTSVPSSTFICGSQGSGKSYTLSCLLENCLAPSDATVLPRPLTCLLFHYDEFISDNAGSPCEAAFLASVPGIKVRVLCSPTNIATIKKTYSQLNVDVQPLQIRESNLNTKRMLDLMAVNQDDTAVPLYIHIVHRILREMRIQQQNTGGSFNYGLFKSKVAEADLTAAQLAPLSQRLSVLESFMPKAKGVGTEWSNEYMSTSPESTTLTNTILSTVRLQRHLGVRIIIATQEPTISPSLLDLCSVTIIHRFTSPAWIHALRAHTTLRLASEDITADAASKAQDKIFQIIVRLNTGEALVFAPNAAVGMKNKGKIAQLLLGSAYLEVKIRARLSNDGGESLMAN
ncbi:hypothetical protein NOR_08666 [Metarhizium rileyi]|uniref:P-loop containing nucleoside triphosphate hydrolase protein n=1 Tax=Metarhizium rileyi (strain RCEF 4871) TaxID=1649241 RepID=A0A166VX54_METRR|nr:hypothetical protein NOR_08666 [Metarhizium rileyi RCEF 4871]